MLGRWLPLLASGCAALALTQGAWAASAISAAAITAGRLYVIGTTDRPHTRVSINDTFTAESDDQGKFQFELLYYPAGCIVHATIGDRTVDAKVLGCGEICEPVLQADTLRPSGRNLSKSVGTGPRIGVQSGPLRKLGTARLS